MIVIVNIKMYVSVYMCVFIYRYVYFFIFGELGFFICMFVYVNCFGEDYFVYKVKGFVFIVKEVDFLRLGKKELFMVSRG